MRRQQCPLPVPPAIHAGGLTLIELMVTVAVIAVLASLAAPSFLRQIAASRLASTSNALHSALSQARTQAMATGVRVVACRSNDQSSCDTNSSRNWSTGWIVFRDTDADNERDSTEVITHSAAAVPGQLVVRGNTPVEKHVSYRASGQSAASGTVRVCSTSAALGNDERTRDLVVINNGRVVIEDTPGVLATCPSP